MRVAHYHVGIRTDDHEHLELLRHLYSSYLVEDPGATADLNLVVRPVGIGPRRLPYLTHGGQPLMRTRSLRRLLRRLDLFLGRLADPATELAEVHDMGALIRGDSAVLVPREVLERSSGVERLTREHGAGISEAAGTRLDLASGQVVVTAGLSGWGDVTLQDDVTPRPGPYSLVAVCWPESLHAKDERPATALLRLAQRLVVHDGDLPGVLHQVARLRGTFSPLAMATTGVDDIREALALLRP